MSEPMTVKSKEFFYKDKDGKPQDADLHEPILASDHAAADAIGRDAAKRAGLTDEEIARLYAEK